MTNRERALLTGPVRAVIAGNRDAWDSLNDQVVHGPRAEDFPHYPAALDFVQAVKEAVHGLSVQDKQDLIAEWRRVPRLVDRSTDDSILAGYAVVVLDQIVEKAKTEATRTTH
jgi:hypothetical protein